jgi:hypothetical protein
MQHNYNDYSTMYTNTKLHAHTMEGTKAPEMNGSSRRLQPAAV